MYQLFNEYKEAREQNDLSVKLDVLCENMVKSGLTWETIQEHCVIPAALSTDGNVSNFFEDVNFRLNEWDFGQKIGNLIGGKGWNSNQQLADQEAAAKQQADDDAFNQRNSAFQQQNSKVFELAKQQFMKEIGNVVQNLQGKLMNHPQGQMVAASIQSLGNGIMQAIKNHQFNLSRNGGGIRPGDVMGQVHGRALQNPEQVKAMASNPAKLAAMLKGNPNAQQMLQQAMQGADMQTKQGLLAALKASGWVSPDQQGYENDRQRWLDAERRRSTQGGVFQPESDEDLMKRMPANLANQQAWKAQMQQQGKMGKAGMKRRGLPGGPPVMNAPVGTNSSTTSGMRQDHAENDGDLMIESLVETYSYKPKFGLF